MTIKNFEPIKPIWPDSLEKGEFTPDKTRTRKENKKLAIADAYAGWGLCSGGFMPCDNFGHGMVSISNFLGIPSATPKELDKALKDIDKRDAKSIMVDLWHDFLEWWEIE